MKKGTILLVVAVLVAAVAVTSLFGWCGHTTAPIPKDVVKTIDSLKTTKPVFDSIQKANLAGAALIRSAAAQQAAAAVAAVHRADRKKAHADSLAEASRKLSGNPDSLPRAYAKLDSAYKHQDSSYKELRVSFDSLVDVKAKDDRAYNILLSSYTDLNRRYAVTETLNARLERAAKDANKCYIIWKIGCPTRKEVFVAGLTLGAVGAYNAKGVSRKVKQAVNKL